MSEIIINGIVLRTDIGFDGYAINEDGTKLWNLLQNYSLYCNW